MKGFILCCGISMVLVGCSAYDATVEHVADSDFRMYTAKPLYEVKNDKDKNKNKEVLKPSFLNVVLKTDNSTSSLIDKECFTPETNAGGKCKQERNIAISTLMLTSEEICLKHRRNMYGNEAGSNLFLGSFTNLFSGVATVILPATSKSIFSALALFTNAERSLVNESIYKKMLVTAIDDKTVTKRDELALNISTKMKEPIEEYSVAQAMYDVSAFHSKCSFMEGLRFALDEGSGNENARRADALKIEISETELKIKLMGEDSLLKERRENLYSQLNALGVAAADSGGKTSPVPAKK